MNPDNTYVLFVRLRQGIVGERARAVHVVPLADATLPEGDTLTAYCGEELARANVDYLDSANKGFPCVSCLVAVPLPIAPNLPPPPPAGV